MISVRFFIFGFPQFFLYSLFALDIRSCIRQCEETGCVGPKCFPQCSFSSDGELVGRPWYIQEPLYLQWKKWDCLSDCRYYCMLDREKEKELLNHDPVKYHGKWPFKRIYGMQVCSHAPYVFICVCYVSIEAMQCCSIFVMLQHYSTDIAAIWNNFH